MWLSIFFSTCVPMFTLLQGLTENSFCDVILLETSKLYDYWHFIIVTLSVLSCAVKVPIQLIATRLTKHAYIVAKIVLNLPNKSCFIENNRSICTVDVWCTAQNIYILMEDRVQPAMAQWKNVLNYREREIFMLRYHFHLFFQAQDLSRFFFGPHLWSDNT